MQDREAVRRVYRYLARMKRAPGIVENPDLVWVIGDIKSVELLDELGKFVDLAVRDNFRDRKCNGLKASLVAAFCGIASNGQQEKEMVLQFLDNKTRNYWNQWLQSEGVDVQNKERGNIENRGTALHIGQSDRSNGGNVQGVSKKVMACICLTEDVRWRIAEEIA